MAGTQDAQDGARGCERHAAGGHAWWSTAGVFALTLAELGYAAWVARLLWPEHGSLGPLRSLAGVAAASALAGIFTLRLEFRRHQMVITLAEAVLTVGLFAVGPIGLGVALAVGDLAGFAFEPISPFKAYFNLVNRLATAITAGALFTALTAHGDKGSTAMLFAALLTAICYSLLDVASTSAAVSISERSPFAHMLSRSAPAALLASAASAPLGIVAVVLDRLNPIAPLILLPTLVAVALNARYSTLQRAEHLRFERLYESSFTTAELGDLERVVERLADTARKLVTGTAALCMTTDAHGEPFGVIVDDAGATRVSRGVTSEFAALLTRDTCGEVPAAEAGAFAEIMPTDANAVVYASVTSNSSTPFGVAVFRNTTAKQRDRSRVETLRAFASQGALATANARLFGERDEALRQQVDLNRQKGDFVAAVSHELRTPLAATMGAVETVLRLDTRLDADDRGGLLRLALDRADTLRRLIDDLLMVAASEHRAPSIAREAVSVREVVAAVGDELPDAKPRLVLNVPEREVRVFTDRDKFHRIIRNLVENAAKYAPSGPIEINVEERLSALAIGVRDYGPGIAEAQRDRVFERFVQLDQSSRRHKGGTGLGLYLSRQLAHALGGTLTLDAPLDRGSSFTFTHPTSRIPDAVAQAPSGTTRTVLRRPTADVR